MKRSRKAYRLSSNPVLVPRQQLAQLRHVPKALKLVWAAAPGWTATTVILLGVQGLLPIFVVYLTRVVVNDLVAVVDSGGESASLGPAALSISLMGLVLLLSQIAGSAATYVHTILAEQMQITMNDLIQAKAITLDLEFYESPTYYDQLQRASIDAIDRPLGLLTSLSGLLQNSLTLLAMGGVLFTFAWWLPLLLLGGALPALVVALRATWRFHRWRLENTLNQRRLAYYHRLLATDYAAAEVRLFGLGHHFRTAYQTLRRTLRDERLRLAQSQLGEQILATGLGLLTLAGALAWIAWRALQGLFNLGDIAMFYQTMSQGQRLMTGLLTGVGEIYRNLAFLDDLFLFLELQPKLVDPAQPVQSTGLRQAVALKNVTFHYPGSPRPALVGFNLCIPAGQIVAIVGENGSGKTTLIKLLCRFYDPQQGHITWDGVTLPAMSQADLRRRISVLFQQPVPYHTTAAENIAFGDLAGQPRRAQIEAVAASGGADTVIGKLPEGYEAVLGRW
ncbi:MAG TPA: ABC transporter ATP-binding protein, partial [Anaerolineae bacterium]|nr:ABC transporter ATP-binding protein [Anaerolineae bacterium]